MENINLHTDEIISNEKIDYDKLKRAKEIILELQKEVEEASENGAGPFIAAIYDDKGKFVAKAANSVINDTCSNNHAEMNAIKEAERFYGSYDLSKYNLSIYVTSEPCIMCLGGIMWSGIKNVYFGVQSKNVELITGFDEGFKPNWLEEFKQRGITVYGNIESQAGEDALRKYVQSGKTVYKPDRV